MLPSLNAAIVEFVKRMADRKYAFTGRAAISAYGVRVTTRDFDVITKTPKDFEAAILSLTGMGFKEIRPSPDRFVPAFARFQHAGITADIAQKKIHFKRGEVEQKVTPDTDFWKNISFRGRETFGADVPVPSPVDLAVLKVVSSVSPIRDPFKTRQDREDALWLIERHGISSGVMLKRARMMGCAKAVQEFLEMRK